MQNVPRIAVSSAAIPDPDQRQKVSDALARVLAQMRDGPWKAELRAAEGAPGGVDGGSRPWTLRLQSPSATASRPVPAADQNVRGVVRLTQAALFAKWPARRSRPAAGVRPNGTATSIRKQRA